MPVPRDRSEAAALLGLHTDADADAITDRYRTLAQIFHPDRNPHAPTADARMQELNIARDLLLDRREESAPFQSNRATRESDPAPARSKAHEQRLAAAMHEMPYGVYFVGTQRDQDPSGMIADWVLQISFTPRLVCIAFEPDSYSLASIQQNRALSLCLLAEDCFQLAGRFLQPRDPAKVRGRSKSDQLRDKLAGADYWTTTDGCPVLTDALTWLHCQAQQFIPAGDHILVLSHVLDGGVQRQGEPLTSLNTGWTYSG